MKTEMNIIVEEYLLEHLLGPNYPHEHLRERKRKQLRDGVMDERMIFIEIPEVEKILMKHSDNATFEDIIQAMREFKPGRTLYPYKERTSIKDAKHLLNQHLTDGLIKEQNVIKEALEAV